MKKYIKAGYVITCVGDKGDFSFLESRHSRTLSDRVAIHTLDKMHIPYKQYSYLARGSDERQYNSPGVDLPIASITRSKYHEYPEYHTSADDFNFIKAEYMEESINVYKRCVDVLEGNYIYKNRMLCEPQLGKRDLYPSISIKSNGRHPAQTRTDILAYCNGKNSIFDVANIIGIELKTVIREISLLKRNNIIRG